MAVIIATTLVLRLPEMVQSIPELAKVITGKRTEAADSLLAIVKADRTWNDDGARQQLLKFFDAWGPTDEATLSARRKLSSILFS